MWQVLGFELAFILCVLFSIYELVSNLSPISNYNKK